MPKKPINATKVVAIGQCSKFYKPKAKGADRPYEGVCMPPEDRSLGKIRKDATSSVWSRTKKKAFNCSSGVTFTDESGKSRKGRYCEMVDEPNVVTIIHPHPGVDPDSIPTTAYGDYMCGCYMGKRTGDQPRGREYWQANKHFWTYRFGGPDDVVQGPPPEFVLDRPSWSEPGTNLMKRKKVGYVMWYDTAYKRFHAKCTSLAQRGLDERGNASILREGKVKACGHDGDSTCEPYLGTKGAVLSCGLSGSGDDDWSGRSGTCEWINPPPGMHTRRFEMRTSAGSGETVSADDLARYACGSYRIPDGAGAHEPFRYTGYHSTGRSGSAARESWSPSGNVWIYDK